MPYLDHAATTPMLPQATDAVSLAMRELGNPSSQHTSGRRSRRRVEEARESIAAALGARPSEVIFTSGGTESDNIAVKGLFWQRRAADPRRVRIVASPIEHHAVLDSVDWLVEQEGAKVTWLEVDEYGRVSPGHLREVLASDPESVALVSVMWANNEVGTVQPVGELAAVAHEFDVPFHTDAVQAFCTQETSFEVSGADALSLSGHKFGGPHGAGVLLLSRGLAPVPLSHGGDQERGVRSGTLDVPAIAGLATAIEHVAATRSETAARLAGLRARLIEGVHAVVPDVIVNGHPSEHVAGIAHLSFPGCEGDSLLMLLDAREVECSTGSACQAGIAQPSHVLLAMGAGRERARGSLRFSLGWTSTQHDVDALVEAIAPVVERAKKAGLSA